MITKELSQRAPTGKMQVGGRGIAEINAASPKLSISSPSSLKAAPSPTRQNDLYGNFGKEMSLRLKSVAPKNTKDNGGVAGSSVFIQSLIGAMGEIEQTFGREAATEVMAKILIGTDKGVTEDSLLSALQSGLAGLKRLDFNGTKIKNLTQSFNKDLALNPELAEKKAAGKETMSLSYALADYFGSVTASPAGNPALPEETYEMSGFDETGKWDAVQVARLDESASEELQEKAEAGISQAAALTMAAIMEKENGDGKLFQGLADYLKDSLQDKEAAAFVEQCVIEAQFSLMDKYGSSPEMAKMLSQVYSKVAADGDADKLALLENYINTDFKNALNPILAEMQRGGEAAFPGAEVGELQFKGISGASLAGENDIFSLNWGYKGDKSYDQSISKRFLQENIREVKAAQEKKEKADQDDQARLREETVAGRIAREARKVRAEGNAQGKGDAAGLDAGDLSKSEKLREKFADERRQKKLEETMSTKFGQLGDGSREELERYIRDRFADEDAEELLEHTKWSNNLMGGLADIYGQIREADKGDGDKANDFVKFLNGGIKKEIDGITGELGDMSFDGWQTADESSSGEFEATFRFTGRPKAANVVIPASKGAASAEARSAMEKLKTKSTDHENSNVLPKRMQKIMGVGYLVDMMA